MPPQFTDADSVPPVGLAPCDREADSEAQLDTQTEGSHTGCRELRKLKSVLRTVSNAVRGPGVIQSECSPASRVWGSRVEGQPLTPLHGVPLHI